MKSVLSIAFATIVASGSAMAADIPVKAPVLKAPPPAVWTWDGFYIGAHVGYSWGDWDSFCLFTNCFVANSGSFITPNVAGNAAALAAFLASFTNSASP